MAQTAAATRYAKALFDLAKDQQALEPVETDLQDLQTLIQQNDQLRELFSDPVIREDVQESAIHALFHDRVHMLTERFLLLLVEKGRLDHILAICRVFLQLCDDDKGLIHAQVATAQPMDDDQLQALKTRLEEKTGKTVVTHVQVDPSLLGGFKVKMGDQVMDLTLQNQLQRLQENIINA